MKARKSVCIVVLCLMAAIVISFSLWLRATRVQAASLPAAVRQSAPTQAAAPAHSSVLRAAAMGNALLLDNDAAPRRVGTIHTNPAIPPVQEFILTPPNPAQNKTKTTLQVRFEEASAEKLDSQLPFTLGDQRVVLQRSADNPAVFSTEVSFDWNAFAREQAQRKLQALAGAQVPVFEQRRLLRMDEMSFVDPAEIRQTMQTHQPLHFSSKVLLSGTLNIEPETELFVTNVSVVEDLGRTFNPCTPINGGRPQGAWTFGNLMIQLAGSHAAADQMVQNWLMEWESSQTVENGIQVAPRSGQQGQQDIVHQVISRWTHDTSGNVDVNL